MKSHPMILTHPLKTILVGVVLICTILATSCTEQTRGDQAKTEGKLTLKEIRDSLEILTDFFYSGRVSDNQVVGEYSKLAMQLAQQTTDPNVRVRALIYRGNYLLGSSPDSSYQFYMRALNIADSADLPYQKSRLYYGIGNIHRIAYDFQQAAIYYDSAITTGWRGENIEMVICALNVLATINFDLHDFQKAKLLWDSSYNLAKSINNYRYMGVALSNLSKYAGTFDSTILIKHQAIEILKKNMGQPDELGSVYNNLGAAFINPDSAIYYCRKAVEIGEKYSYPIIEIGGYNNMAYGYLDKGDLKQAEACLIDHAIPLCKEINNIDWLSTLYDSYADVLSAMGNYKKAFSYMKESMYAREEANQQLAMEQNRLLLAILDTKQKETLIRDQQLEIQKKSDQLLFTRLWLAISILLFVSVVLILLWLFQRNRIKLQREQILSAKRIIEIEENEKGKTARELHDITGQMVMSIASRIEEVEIPDQELKEEIKTTLNELSQSIRMISHRMNIAMMEHYSFDELVIGLCEDMQKLSGIIFQVDIPRKDLDLPEEMVLHTYRIIQELIVNAGKYAPDCRVKIGLHMTSRLLTLVYEDDGPGFDTTEKRETGMGIFNIMERVKLMGGEALLESAPGKGTNWEIRLPLIISQPKTNKKTSS